MKQDQDIKSGPPKKEPDKNIFAKLMSVIMSHHGVVGSGDGKHNNSKRFDPNKRKIRNRIARLSRRKNRK